MKEIWSLLFSTLLLCFTLFSFTGCEDKKEQAPLIPVENTTEVFTEKNIPQEEEEKKEAIATVGKKEVKTEIQEAQIQEALTEEIELNVEIEEKNISQELPVSQIPANAFTLSDIQQNKHTVSMDDQKITFHDIDQSIVVINFFTTWYSPCRGEIPYLADLQKKYEKNVFVAGILINDTQDNDTLKQFISKYSANYFISNSKQNDAFASKIVKELQLPENFPIPLTVIYKDGDYFTHYEGAVPIEMIYHDIKQIIKE